MKTIICGGRDYVFTNSDIAWLDKQKAGLPITEVVSGGASGADRCGEGWALISAKLPVKKFPADWNTLGKGAGPMRNAQMADYAEACIAFPGGRGTADMLDRAHRKGLKIIQSPSRLATIP